MWLRRIVHEQLFNDYGADYLSAALAGDRHLFSNTSRTQAGKRMRDAVPPYARQVDALVLSDLQKVICGPETFQCYFAAPFHRAYPGGGEVLGEILLRLIAIRNDLSPGKHISSHAAERVFCYCADIALSLMDYYKARGKEKDFIAPTFVGFRDSHGHSAIIEDPRHHLDFVPSTRLHCGELLTMEVEVDSTFSPDTYDIHWTVSNLRNPETQQRPRLSLRLDPRHVNERFGVQVNLISRKPWQRFGNVDSYLTINYRVLPPLA